MSTNGHTTKRPFKDGVHCPLITPFKAGSEDIDIQALQKQVVRLAKANVGIVLLGTNGEASHLSDEERRTAISSSRSALDDAGFTSVPILVGTGTGSARETVKLCKEAKEAGADYTIVIPPGYFSFAVGKNKAALKAFFWEVFEKSPLPVMVYNFPGAAAGIDLDSDFLIELSEHPNCFGAKLTCGGIGKGQRLSIHTQSKEYLSRHGEFFVLPGFSDILLPSVMARMRGTITGTGNIIPKTIAHLYELILKAQKEEKGALAEAIRVQDIVAKADWAVVKAGIGGTKWALDEYVEKGLGGVPRNPLPEADDAIKKMLGVEMKESLEFEKSLP